MDDRRQAPPAARPHARRPRGGERRARAKAAAKATANNENDSSGSSYGNGDGDGDDYGDGGWEEWGHPAELGLGWEDTVRKSAKPLASFALPSPSGVPSAPPRPPTSIKHHIPPVFHIGTPRALVQVRLRDLDDQVTALNERRFRDALAMAMAHYRRLRRLGGPRAAVPEDLLHMGR